MFFPVLGVPLCQCLVMDHQEIFSVVFLGSFGGIE
jgi:hypothetical protein